MIKKKKMSSKFLSIVLAAAMVAGIAPQFPASTVEAAFNGPLSSVKSAKANDNVVEVSFNNGDVKGKITFLEDGIFRYNVDPSGKFSEYATVNNAADTAKIPQYPDSSDKYSHPKAKVSDENGNIVIAAGKTKITFDKDTAKMTVAYNDNVVMQESAPLSLGTKTTQSLVKNSGENFYGGGTQNGRFVHTGETIHIANESNWVDGGVASPNPFYYSSNGYGVLRNTFLAGSYDFGNNSADTVATAHNENEYDAYIFLSDGANAAERVQDLLGEYYHVTGAPVLLPEYAFYEGHLNCYNRDSWSDNSGSKKWEIKGSASATTADEVPIASSYYESGMSTGYVLKDGMSSETLNGTKPTTALDKYPSVNTDSKYSARAVIDQYDKYDMPIGYFLPNDGYGCGYGQNGYYQTGGVNADGSSSAERTAAVDANVNNLKEFTKYAQSKGLQTGLWTQSNLSPDSNSNTSWHLLRDFEKEVKVGGITTLKTDVAWVGYGYNFALNGTKTAYDIVTTGVSKRPNIITLDGWASTQRFGAIWTGDQYGGNWEYIRFHVPTYIGQSLSGNPNIGSDMDGIFGGDKIVSTRDTQWKVFTPLMLNMDGWGSYAKTPQTFGDPYTGINRMYLKLKAQLMPYIYTSAAAAANLDTGNGDTGLPMIRAMFLEYPGDAYASTKDMQYQYMFGSNVLVAPIYQNTSSDTQGNDVRNGIYLPDADQIWIDYFTGEQYYGGQTLNNFDAPIWKLPIFVKNGSIIPMWEENNSPSKINKANRSVEFWPAGSTEYTMYEDDGITAENKTTEVDGYGTVADVSYGEHVSQKFTSKVEGDVATLTAEKASGSYAGYDKNKNTTFVVNVSKEPTAITAQNGSTELTKVAMNSKDEVLNADVAAGTFAYYYDESPAIEYYGVEAEDEFAAMMKDQTSSPKLYVKFANTDSQANAQTLVLEGFENNGDMSKNQLNPDLAAPAKLTDDVTRKTPTSNTLTWDAVDDATSYEILVDGIINTAGDATEFAHTDLKYNSTHTYKVRARNKDGYSEWSEEVTATTSLDPWRNVPTPEKITWTGGDAWGKLANLTDHDISEAAGMFHSTGDVVTDAIPMIFDYGQAYALDKLEYYARHDNYGNGAVQQMNVETSLDGVNWTTQWIGSEHLDWTYNAEASIAENMKEIPLRGAARYVKIVITKSKGNFFSGDELAIYKKDGTNGFAVGSTNNLGTVADGDYTNMKNYLGFSKKDGETFVKQIEERFGDINGNGYYDVWDYAFTMFNLDGGTQKTGKVSGNIVLLPSATGVKEGETFTVDVYADNVKNLNAFGEVLDYDPAVLQYVDTTADFDISQMENLTVNKVYEDGTAYVNLAFANRGNQATYSGTGVIATITMKAKKDFTLDAKAMDLSQVMLIGPEFDLINCESSSAPELPDIITGGEKTYTYGEDFDMTMTNKILTEDDGKNVEKFIQSKTYGGLFNGTQGREFELKWYPDEWTTTVKGLPEHVKVPVTFHIDVKQDAADEVVEDTTEDVADEAEDVEVQTAEEEVAVQADNTRKVTTVTLQNANKANGYVTSVSAKFTYSDDTTSSASKSLDDWATAADYSEFTFNAEADKTVTKVDVTVNSVANAKGESVENMLTLSTLTVATADGKLSYGSDFTMTMTNDVLTSDDGDNVKKMIQQGSFSGLFGGQGRNFEFLWDIPSNYVDKEVKYVEMPVTLHMNMKKADTVSTVSVYNAPSYGNGYMTDATATFTYEDGTTADVNLKDQGAKFEFANPNKDAKVTKVSVTANQASGTNMLTLSELEVKAKVDMVPVTKITPAEDNVKELYAGSMADINATIEPENATNPYFVAASSNENVVRIITLADENGLPIYKAYAVGEGKAKITLTARESMQDTAAQAEGEDPAAPITASYEITVLAGADKTELVELITEYSKTNPKFYTEESFKALTDAINAANAVKDNAEATKDDVKKAIAAMKKAADALEESELTAEAITDKSGMTADAPYSEENVPSALVDGDETNYWESPYYGNNVGLPKEITLALGDAYDLEKVEIVKNTGNGKVTDYEVLVSTDGENFTSVGRKTIDENEMRSGIRMEQANITHVKVIIHGAKTGGRDVAYARLSEINFYGKKVAEPADKKALTETVDKYKDLKQENYTDETWKTFAEALKTAQNVLADEKATQETVDAAVKTLNDAYKGLVKKELPNPDQPVVKDALKAAVDKNADKKQGDYTADSWAKFSAALAHAQAVLNDPNATADQVSAALKGLEEAAAALTTGQSPAAKDELQAVYNGNKDREKKDYTADSWKAFSTALSNAEKILKNPNATSQEISDALNALKTAVADLKTVAEKKDEDNKKQNSSGSSGSSKSNTTSTTSAQTGDTAQPLLYVVLIAAAAAVLALIRRKRMK